jgi:hypothetical protein
MSTPRAITTLPRSRRSGRSTGSRTEPSHAHTGGRGLRRQPPKFRVGYVPYPAASACTRAPAGYIATDIFCGICGCAASRAAPHGLRRVWSARRAIRPSSTACPHAKTPQEHRNMRASSSGLGMGYDWDREIATTDSPTTSGRSGSFCNSTTVGTIPRRILPSLAELIHSLECETGWLAHTANLPWLGRTTGLQEFVGPAPGTRTGAN